MPRRSRRSPAANGSRPLRTSSWPAPSEPGRPTSPSRSAWRLLASAGASFWRAADLVRVLVEARDKRELSRLQRRLGRVDLLVLDEVGFVPFDREGGELLFNLVADRYERRSVLVTSNLAFGEWPKVFGGDEKLTTALLDRLAHHATVITTKGKSFRMRRRQEATASPGGPKKG
jgi:hypothetical protein